MVIMGRKWGSSSGPPVWQNLCRIWSLSHLSWHPGDSPSSIRAFLCALVPIWTDLSDFNTEGAALPSPVSLGIGNDSAGWRQWNDGGNFCQWSTARQPPFALPMYHEGAGYFVWRTHWQLAGLCVSPCLGCEFYSARVSFHFWASYMIIDVHFYLHIGYCTWNDSN